MKLCDVSFCDFVMWKSDEFIVCRIETDDIFLTEAIDKATNFYKYDILPELVGKWYTRIQPIEQATSSALSSQTSSHASALHPLHQASTSASGRKNNKEGKNNQKCGGIARLKNLEL